MDMEVYGPIAYWPLLGSLKVIYRCLVLCLVWGFSACSELLLMG